MTTTRPPARAGSRAAQPPEEPPAPRKAVIAVRRLFAAEAPEYFMLLGTTLFLVVFGLVMVLSSSSIESYVSSKDFFTTATRQGLYALVGVPVMLIAARAPIGFWKRWAPFAVFVGIGLQLLVFTPLGWGNGFNTNWIRVGSFSAQPSELVKLALVIWLAWVLTHRSEILGDWKRVLFTVGPLAGISIALVLGGADLGTAIILVSIVLGALFYAGFKARYLAVTILVMGVVGSGFVAISPSRLNRVEAWLGGCTNPDVALTDCYQTTHGWQALAHGGVFGVGLGNSTGKWSWVPEADNDFIFSIIGEELGLIGAILVLLLFVLLAICFVRIIRMSSDPFAKIATSAAMVWIIGQALVNIAVVLGLLPVLGVPLPLVSAGGSALITTLAAIGVVLSFARTRPAQSDDDFSSSPRPPVPTAVSAVGVQCIRWREFQVTTYLFAGGGTAGHVNPLLATADRLREREPDAEVIVLGTAEGLEARLVPEHGYELLTIPRLPFPRRPNRAALAFPATWRSTVDRVRGILRDRQVDVVVGFGGYAAAPAYRAARLEKLPMALHEQNAKPGIANRVGARLTRFVGVTFASTSLAHSTVVGLPLRREIERLDLPSARSEGRALFELDHRMPTLLVTGGSLGARRLNESVSQSVAALLGSGWQVLHLTGSRAPVVDPGLAGYRILEYSDRMDLALAVTDLAVSRAGAGTLAELTALGIPAVLIPYAVGNGEQAYNARDAVNAGGAIVVTDSAFTPDYVETRLPALLRDRARIADMAARMASIGVRDGADRMVDLVLAARHSVLAHGQVA